MLNTAPLPGAERGTLVENVVPSPYWLEELALNLARNLKTISRPDNSDPLPQRSKTLVTFLQSAYHYYDELSRSDTPVSHAAEWVLDNFYIIEQALRQINENIPPDFYQRLPKVNVN